MFAILIEDSTGNYQQSTDNTFPGYEYFYNQTKSGCMNANGKQLSDSLLYDQDNKKATVKVSSSSRCYLYFDRWKEESLLANKFIASGDLWQSGLEDDGYRYVGSGAVGDSTNPNNFICFGTSDMAECTANQDKYMYRIIGVFADANGENHVKLIKYKQLGKYSWNDDNSVDIPWEDSDLYKGLNGSYFLTNAAYDYLQDVSWSNKIENWTWSAVNTMAYENDGENDNPYYMYSTPKGIYLNEMHIESGNYCYNIAGEIVNCNGGKWTNPVAKVGLMYASDFSLSLGNDSLNYNGMLYEFSDMINSWIYPNNNDNSIYTAEWIMSRENGYNDFNQADRLEDTMYEADVSTQYALRPVFYLTNNLKLVKGDGNINNPFILTENNESALLKVSLTAEYTNLKISITSSSSIPQKYCVNDNNTIIGCDWNKISSNSISYVMDEHKTYYVFVTDDSGNMTTKSYTYKAEKITDALINSKKLYQTNLEGDGYRYVGSGAVGTSTNPDNFICFGTTSKSDCTSNPGKYMYRIIGVFADTNGSEHAKLIKYKQLDTAYTWYNSSTNIIWESSLLYKGLNGNYFLSNTDYSYMQDSVWNEKIENWAWNAVTTKLYTSDLSPKNTYLHEMNRSSKTSSSGTWNTVKSKVGLMYVSDCVLSLGDKAMQITGDTFTNRNTLNDGWMYPKNNDKTKSSYEWTISYFGLNGEFWAAYNISDFPGPSILTSSNGVRPVFYLTSNTKLSSGIGTIDDPFIIN